MQDNMLGHEIRLNKLKRIEIILTTFSNNNGFKLEIKTKMKFGKLINMWKLTNVLLNNQWIKEEIVRENRKYFVVIK